MASGGGAKGHGAELMNNIAIASMHAILYIDILGPTFVVSGGGGGGGMAPLPPHSITYGICYRYIASPSDSFALHEWVCSHCIS